MTLAKDIITSDADSAASETGATTAIPTTVEDISSPAKTETGDEVAQLLERVANAQTFNDLHKASLAADDWSDQGDERCVKVYEAVIERANALKNEIIKRAETEFNTNETMIKMYYPFQESRLKPEVLSLLRDVGYGLFDFTQGSTKAKLGEFVQKKTPPLKSNHL